MVGSGSEIPAAPRLVANRARKCGSEKLTCKKKRVPNPVVMSRSVARCAEQPKIDFRYPSPIASDNVARASPIASYDRICEKAVAAKRVAKPDTRVAKSNDHPQIRQSTRCEN